MSMTKTPLTVTELNRQVKTWLEHDLPPAFVVGELSNLSRPSSGHLYFTLKDSQASIRCVCFRSKQPRDLVLNDGLQVILMGQLSLYEARGDYQLIVEKITDAGVGQLYQQFEALKAKLLQAGLFDVMHKKPLPLYPKTIGLITSPSGAAIQDMLTTLKSRYPLASIVIYGCEVQGQTAHLQLIQAIQIANQTKQCDVLILARGGGSLEDLWAFNREELAYAMVESELPIITGVGHETDTTIADFVADYRAPTPTAAAQAATPNQADLMSHIHQLTHRLTQRITQQLHQKRLQLTYLMNRIQSPKQKLNQQMQQLDYAKIALNRVIQNKMSTHRQRLNQLLATLHVMSPLATLDRGYAIALYQGKALSNPCEVPVNATIEVQLAQGVLDCQVLGHTPCQISNATAAC
jgi:exodeoxyribonuclease VII large subunit